MKTSVLKTGVTLACGLALANQVKSEADFYVACGNQATARYEIYDESVTDWNSSSALKWTFHPTTANGWTSSEVAAYSNCSDLKLRNCAKWGNVVVSCASGGLATIATYSGGAMKWALDVGGSNNPHSVELLPNGNIAVAASAGGWVRVYASSQSSHNSTYAQYNLTGAHAVLWDPMLNELWVMGDSVITTLKVGGSDASPTLTEDTVRHGATTSGGHDLSPYYGDFDRLWMTMNGAVATWNKAKHALTYESGADNRTSVKGCGNQPSGEIVETKPNSVCTLDTWCTPYVDFFTSSGATDYSRQRTGAAFYKCRLFTSDYQPGLHANPCTATTADGRLEVFMVGNTGYLYHNYQTTPGGSWSGWIALSTSNTWNVLATPAVGVNPDGRLEVCIMGTDGRVNHTWQHTPGSSAATNWASFTVFTSSATALPTARIAIGNLANGQPDVFVIGTDGALYHNYVGSSGWTGFTSLGGAWSQWADIAVGNESDGREDVFLIGNTGNLYNNWQTAPNDGTNWNGWNNLGGTLGDNVRTALGRNTDGRLEIFTVNGAAYHNWELASNSPASWNGWSSLSGTWNNAAKPIVAPDQNGALELFLIGNTGYLYHNYENGSGWSGWLSLGGSFKQNVQPCVGVNQDGTLAVFSTTDTQTALFEAVQTSANSATWSGWTSLGGTWQ